ncbi:MAG: D-allose transporter subunit [Frankiales bacterium]|jgi:ABC-type sugar transport system substrate-binding protein|nr:D-allose transporter subunit [Frankiales bacterium]
MMKPTRPMTYAATLAGAALLLTACGGSSKPAASSSSGSGAVKVAAVIKGLDNPFFQAMQNGINSQAKTDGLAVTVQAATSITDTTGQADKLTAMAGQSFNCFVVNPISGSNLVQGLAQLARKNVPIVNIDSPVDAKAASAAGVKIATYIGTDNVEAGGKGGEQMLKAIGGSGKVALIGGIAGDVTSGARLEGFTKAVQGKATIVQTVAADWERQKALTAATDLMRAHPDLKGFFAANDDMGLGIARAVANARKTGKIAVISVDGNKDALEAVKSGDLTATVAQYPYAIGSMGVQACEAAVKGTTLPSSVKAPTALVTQDVADQAIAKFPAPFQAFQNPLVSPTP